MPPDFYDLWKYCQERNPKRPQGKCYLELFKVF